MSSVLVIDDDRTVRHLIRQALDGADVEVMVAGSAEEGLASVRQHRPDVVLLDVVLPGASGLDLFRQIHDVRPAAAGDLRHRRRHQRHGHRGHETGGL